MRIYSLVFYKEGNDVFSPVFSSIKATQEDLEQALRAVSYADFLNGLLGEIG